MPLSQPSQRTWQRRLEVAKGRESSLDRTVEGLHDRLDAIDRLLREVYGWFNPYSSDKMCVLCGSQITDPHEVNCPYPKWAKEVQHLIAPDAPAR